MSYNCRAKYLSDGRLRMKASERQRLLDIYEDTTALCEGNFLEDDDCFAPSPDAPDELIITKMRWSGEGSGNTFDTLKDTLLPATLGSAEILFTWEGGNSHSGLIVNDGTAIEADVVFALKPTDKKAA